MLSIQNTNPEWQPLLRTALSCMDQSYLDNLAAVKGWLPGAQHIFSAFKLPLSETQYILFGESPYPRAESANGFAFWDAAVKEIWGVAGLSKTVNRATSLRNFIKMLLLARKDLENTSQADILALDKSHLIQTAAELFNNMMHKGILLLNATLVYEDEKVPFHAKKWLPFMQSLQEQLTVSHPHIQRILLGKIAEKLPVSALSVALAVEHPYNISFITNKAVQDFFQPFDLLKKHEYSIQY